MGCRAGKNGLLFCCVNVGFFGKQFFNAQLSKSVKANLNVFLKKNGVWILALKFLSQFVHLYCNVFKFYILWISNLRIWVYKSSRSKNVFGLFETESLERKKVDSKKVSFYLFKSLSFIIKQKEANKKIYKAQDALLANSNLSMRRGANFFGCFLRDFP